MKAEWWGIIVAIASAFISALVAWWSRQGDMVKAAERFARLELKVDTMWEFQTRRGIAEATVKGFGTVNSPFVPTDEALKACDSMAPDIAGLLENETGTDQDLMLAIERVFGGRILKEMCIPLQIYEGACLILCLEAGRRYAKSHARTDL